MKSSAGSRAARKPISSLVRRGDEVLAAKVYKTGRPQLQEHADYKEGARWRTQPHPARDRQRRAVRPRRGGAGLEVGEADALYKLVGSGVRVPAPVMFYEGVLLMELARDGEGRPAAAA